MPIRQSAAYTTLLFSAVCPAGLTSPFAGPPIDWWDRRPVLIVANVLASLSILVIALLFFMDALMLRQLHVALSISSIANAFTSPSLQSSTPLLVPKERLNQASGLSQLIRAVETILAPGPAGFVAGLFGLGAIFHRFRNVWRKHYRASFSTRTPGSIRKASSSSVIWLMTSSPRELRFGSRQPLLSDELATDRWQIAHS